MDAVAVAPDAATAAAVWVTLVACPNYRVTPLKLPVRLTVEHSGCESGRTEGRVGAGRGGDRS